MPHFAAEDLAGQSGSRLKPLTAAEGEVLVPNIPKQQVNGPQAQASESARPARRAKGVHPQGDSRTQKRNRSARGRDTKAQGEKRLATVPTSAVASAPELEILSLVLDSIRSLRRSLLELACLEETLEHSQSSQGTSQSPIAGYLARVPVWNKDVVLAPDVTNGNVIGGDVPL
jgi:hypothetical protein